MLYFVVLIAGLCQASDLEKGLIDLARRAVIAEVRHLPLPKPLESTPARPVFVTIEHDGKVIGCRGDLSIRTKSLEQEVILAARGAAAHDPRYRPLSIAILKDFLVTVTIIDRLEPLSDIRRLEPLDGLVLKASGKWGIVLPWEGKEPLIRLKWAYQKAGVQQGAASELSRLIATRSRG